MIFFPSEMVQTERKVALDGLFLFVTLGVIFSKPDYKIEHGQKLRTNQELVL